MFLVELDDRRMFGLPLPACGEKERIAQTAAVPIQMWDCSI
jgi:hypothetical protein